MLAENLSLLIPTDRVLLAPWPRTTAIDYQVIVEVTQFDRTLGGEVVLAVRWSMAGADGQELMMFRIEPVAISVLDYSLGFGHTELVTGGDIAA